MGNRYQRNKNTEQEDDSDMAESPDNKEMRKLFALIPGSVEDVLETTATFRKHNIFVFNCMADAPCDLYGELQVDPHWRFFILPEGSKVDEEYIKELGVVAIIVLPDGFKFIYERPVIKKTIHKLRTELIYLHDPYVALIEKEIERMNNEKRLFVLQESSKKDI